MSNYTQQKFRFGDRVEADCGERPPAPPLVGGIARILLGVDAANTHNVLHIYYYGKNTAHKNTKREQ